MKMKTIQIRNAGASRAYCAPVLAVAMLVGFNAQAFGAADTIGIITAVDWTGTDLNGQRCRGKAQGFGPYDYRRASSGTRNIVERRHFTPDVERLVRGSTGTLMADIDYTLRAFPNHPRALWSMTRYRLNALKRAELEGSLPTGSATDQWPPPECYFQKARKSVPDDGIVSAVFAIYLHKMGELDAALEEYLRAEHIGPQTAELAYNTGLLYFDMGDFDKAREYAIKAGEKGYPLQGLQKKLNRVGAGSTAAAAD